MGYLCAEKCLLPVFPFVQRTASQVGKSFIAFCCFVLQDHWSFTQQHPGHEFIQAVVCIIFPGPI